MVLRFIGRSPYWILRMPHCPAAFAYFVQRRSFTPNRSDSVFENPATTAKLTILPAIRSCKRLVHVGQPTHPPLPLRRTGCEEERWIGDQIALKDGKHLLVVQCIWRGPFRASAMRRTKMAAVPAASDGIFFAVAKVTRQCQARTTTSISLSNRQVVNAIPEVVQASRGRTAASTVPLRDR